MWISRGEFRNFRNYEALSLDMDPHVNLFIGPNAAGKTNILEAVCYLSRGRSPRTSSDRELIRWDQPYASVKWTTHSQRHQGTATLEGQLSLDDHQKLKVQFKLNGKTVRSRSDIIGKLPTVKFFLSDLLMLRGTPENRRQSLDGTIAQFEHVHLARLNQYNRIRQQKSQLFRHDPHTIDREVLGVLNQQLVALGVELTMGRLRYLQLVEPLMELRYHEIAQGGEQLSLAYRPSLGAVIPAWETVPLTTVTADQLEQVMHEAIDRVTRDELRRGTVLIGPHRDDLAFYLDGRDASLYGSQGQQRSIVLTFKLAEIALLEKQMQGETPVLLLDDVMAELDPQRQHQLLAHMDPAMQVMMTTTHLDGSLKPLLSHASGTRVFEVSAGHVALSEAMTREMNRV